MRTKSQTVILISLAGLMIISSGMVVWGEGTPELEQGGWESPEISTVDISIENKTGFFRFEFTVTGSAPEGTDHVNVTFGGLNGTRIELAEDIWFSEGGFILFGNGISLESMGNASHTWSNWSFKIRIALPFNGDYTQLADTLLLMLPFEVGDLPVEGLSSNLTENIGNITRSISGSSLFFIARSYNSTGAWGQEAFNITEHVLTAFLQYMIDEGMLEDPFADDDDEVIIEEEEGKKNIGLGPLVLIAIFVIGIVSLLIVVAIVVFLAISSKRKSQ